MYKLVSLCAVICNFLFVSGRELHFHPWFAMILLQTFCLVSKESEMEVENDENDSGEAPVADIEDIGGKKKPSGTPRGLALSNKRTRDGDGTANHEGPQDWREALGPMPSIGNTKVSQQDISVFCQMHIISRLIYLCATCWIHSVNDHNTS